MLVSPPVRDGSRLGVPVSANVSTVFFQYGCAHVCACVSVLSPLLHIAAHTDRSSFPPHYHVASAMTYFSLKNAPNHQVIRALG